MAHRQKGPALSLSLQKERSEVFYKEGGGRREERREMEERRDISAKPQ